jgi:hypothetical protein
VTGGRSTDGRCGSSWFERRGVGACVVVWQQSQEMTIKDSRGPVSGRADTDTLESWREGTASARERFFVVQRVAAGKRR